MGATEERKKIVEELYRHYQANGFITENEALACFAAHKTPLNEIDFITDHLLMIGVIIRMDNDDDDVESVSDRSKLDYNEILNEVIALEPGLAVLVEYFRNINPPQHREAQNLIPQVRNGNLYAQNRLIEMYMRTIIKQALYASKRHKLPLEDTLQDGILGMMAAVSQFNPAEHEKFSTYAPWWISQSIYRRRWLPTNPMYFPAHVKDNFFQIQEQIAEHSCECCYDSADIVCPILVNELATVQKWDEIDSYNLVFYHKQCVYIEDIDEYDDILSDRGMLSELMFECAEASINAITISVAIQTLSEKEQLVIKLRYGFAEGRVCTLEEIGRLLCVTRERIRQIEVKALRKLQRYLSYHKYTI